MVPWIGREDERKLPVFRISGNQKRIRGSGRGVRAAAYSVEYITCIASQRHVLRHINTCNPLSCVVSLGTLYTD
jgi:hypothetical protein